MFTESNELNFDQTLIVMYRVIAGFVKECNSLLVDVKKTVVSKKVIVWWRKIISVV